MQRAVGGSQSGCASSADPPIRWPYRGSRSPQVFTKVFAGLPGLPRSSPVFPGSAAAFVPARHQRLAPRARTRAHVARAPARPRLREVEPAPRRDASAADQVSQPRNGSCSGF